MGGRGSIAGPGARLSWVDVARGIGIIAVVAGHVWTQGPLRSALYSFHMPFFFLLSGMLYRPQPVGAFTRRHLLGQMRPYILFLTLLVLADQLIEGAQAHRPIFAHWPADLGWIVYGGTALQGPFTIFWFVPCLMVGRIAHNLVAARWPDPRSMPHVAIALTALALAYGMGAWTHVGPLGLIAVPMAFFLLWVGAVWRDVRWQRWMMVPLMMLALIGLGGVLPTLNMKAADYGLPILSIAAAIATSLLIFRLSAVIAWRASWLAALGRASLVIMYLHVAVIHYLAPFLGKPVLMALALVGPYLAHRAIAAWRPAARLLL